MKRFFSLLLIAVLLLGTALPANAAVTSGYMAVSVNAYCEDYNGVGQNWQGYYAINDTEITDNSFTIYLRRGDRLDFYTLLGEMDTYPDYGEAYDTYSVLARDIRDGFSYRQVIDVTENGGRYRGYYCTWVVDYSFTPIN